MQTFLVWLAVLARRWWSGVCEHLTRQKDAAAAVSHHAEDQAPASPTMEVNIEEEEEEQGQEGAVLLDEAEEGVGGGLLLEEIAQKEENKLADGHEEAQGRDGTPRPETEKAAAGEDRWSRKRGPVLSFLNLLFILLCSMVMASALRPRDEDCANLEILDSLINWRVGVGMTVTLLAFLCQTVELVVFSSSPFLFLFLFSSSSSPFSFLFLFSLFLSSLLAPGTPY